MATKRKTAAKPTSKTVLSGLTPEQIQATVRAEQDLKAAGLPVPAKVKAIVAAAEAEPHIVEAEAVMHPAVPPVDTQQPIRTGQKYLRTIYNMPFSFRWTNDDDKKCNFELAPRGQRGDLFPISDKNANDSAFQFAVKTNLDLGIIEVVSEEEAARVTGYQTKNMTRHHTPLSVLRSETGKEYAPDSVRLEAEFNSQGVTVARITPSEHSSEVGEVAFNRRGEIDRAPGGNPAIVSDGFSQETAQFIPAPPLSDATRAKIADDIARQKGAEGPGGAGITQVTLEPVQKG